VVEQNDCQAHILNMDDALDHSRWRKMVMKDDW